jgi:hypothetical protein
MATLLERYKIGGCALFPAKRIYSSNGRYWELTDMRLRLWAVAMVCNSRHFAFLCLTELYQVRNTADIEKPPTLKHFAEDQRIQPPASAAVLASIPVPQFPITAPTQSSQDLLLQLAISNPALAQLFLHQQNNQLMVPAPQYIPAPILTPSSAPELHISAPSAPTLASMPQSAPPSPSKAIKLPRPVSTREFCNRYSISASDETKLDLLEFIPGDRGVEKLGREEWHGVGTFSKLAWDRFLSKHREFLADIVKGVWDSDTVVS